jgi:hypothetical protein
MRLIMLLLHLHLQLLSLQTCRILWRQDEAAAAAGFTNLPDPWVAG